MLQGPAGVWREAQEPTPQKEGLCYQPSPEGGEPGLSSKTVKANASGLLVQKIRNNVCLQIPLTSAGGRGQSPGEAGLQLPLF